MPPVINVINTGSAVRPASVCSVILDFILISYSLYVADRL